MNCPECKTGILECVAFIPIRQGTLEMIYAKLPASDEPAISLYLCSRNCGHVHLEAAPETLTLAKRSLRESAYAAGNCPK